MEELETTAKDEAQAAEANDFAGEEQAQQEKNIIQHKCPLCGAPLKYSASAQAVTCEYCNTTFAMSELEADDAKDGKEFDWGEYSSAHSGETLEGTLTYECQSCGAAIETAKTTIATICPYCSNNVVLKKTSTGGLKPNLIIPFNITKDKVPGILKSFTWKKKLLPSNYFNKCKIGEIQGVYVPFWLFSSRLDGSMKFHAEKVRHYTEGDYEVTKTDVYSLVRSGSMDFAKIPVDASIKIDNDLMDSIEPFDYSKLTEFDTKYLAGYFADRFDSPPESEMPRAKTRMTDKAEKLFNSTVSGYSKAYVQERSLKLVKPQVKYALLPVYLFTCKYEGQNYHYAINGQTGKFAGTLPISKRKVRLMFFLNFIIAFGITFAACVLLQLFF